MLRLALVGKLCVTLCLYALTGCTSENTEILKVTMDTETDGEPLCLGGLSARVTHLNKVIYDSGSVPYGEQVDTFVELADPILPTTDVQLEAWCYGADGHEAGYSKVVEPFGRNSLNLVDISFTGRLWSTSDRCREPMEFRGQPPCIRF